MYRTDHESSPVLRLVLLVLAALAGCGGDKGTDAGTDTGTVDSSMEDLVDVPADVPLDAPSDLAMDTVPEAAFRCTSSTECATSADGHVCDIASGRCVQCLASNDTCPTSQHCDGATNTCVAGCRNDDGCVSDAGTPDGGAAGSHCDTATHACVECVTSAHCPLGFLCMGNRCAMGCDTMHGCPSGQACCTGGCVDTAMNVAHCGACGHACTVANGVAGCAASACTVASCSTGFADCDTNAANGCEVDTRVTVANCGTCGHACTVANGTAGCALGACTVATCTTGYADCNTDPTDGCEVNTQSTAASCGSCGHACAVANGVAGCAAGACTVASCNTGFADCNVNSADGCEVDTRTAVANCGTCGHACTVANGVAGCAAGACTVASCNTGFADCNVNPADGCEVDTRTTAIHCGSCGNVCTAANGTAGCAASACRVDHCAAGFADCNTTYADGCEANLAASSSCGSCGVICGTGTGCDTGGCASVMQIDASVSTSCARRADGTVYCWGYNLDGQVGQSLATTWFMTATQVPGVVDAVEVSAGHNHTCVRRAGGTVSCWGANHSGQLGNGTTSAGGHIPVNVTGLTGAIQLGAGSTFACVLLSSGRVRCWGRNDSQQLGNGTSTSSLVPVEVSGLTDAVEIAVGMGHSCARRAAGSIVCWGMNGHGQLGDGTCRIARTAPVVVSGVTDAVHVATGGAFTCAVRATGSVVCWGADHVGQLGDGAVAHGDCSASGYAVSLAPVAVTGLTDAVQIAAGSGTACAIRAGGSVVCWGGNSYGGLGDGTTTNRDAPVTVLSLPSAIEITVGSTHTCARRPGGSAVCWGGLTGAGSGASPTPVSVVGL